MLTLRAPSWPRRTSSAPAKENRSEGSEDAPEGAGVRRLRTCRVLALAANGRLLEALPVFREALQVTRRRAVFSDDKLDRFLARRLNDRAIFAARQAVFTCCDLLGRGAAAALDAGGDPSETATVLRPLVDLARREFGAEHEVTARLAADLTRALYLAGASADDLLEAEALRRESLTGSEAALDASHEEYVRREELVAAAREVGWEPFSCEEIRAVTLN